ncbi:Trk system potassium uptake protein TrkH [Pseudooceanicola batsensis HTCC2597]|uniref:Trk system potassium uptake protein TrkH n=1 Tax=Pseudooceanicola batsensis (strain ATCC BAA-863 / DSM 15984 / KCTC 12145 / HTCC2597) TaxID=252305 RepID=A3TXM0_PSEBH|nr:potassium transporter TrkG [Pseudooceanicola batsensis]EAQ03580.1 Trk system potassium uptake protein TrkH [Pseudooceanicola batsensis HTCC2597]
MRLRLSDQPLFLVLVAAAAASMFAPALMALSIEEFLTARSFFYAGIIGIVATWMIALARGNRSWTGRNADLVGILSLLAAYILIPAYLAIPFHESLRSTSFLNAYVEMISALTTTGAPLFEPGRLNPALELWRAQVGWMGGLMIWVAAAAVLAPLNLGGFEVTLAAAPGSFEGETDRFRRADILRRVLRGTAQLGPTYIFLTAVLWVLLLVNGDDAFVALCHAMSTMATSGISPVGGLPDGASGIPGEMVIFLFLIFALSRVSFSSDTSVSRFGLHLDPELRMGALIVVGVPVLLFLRHWIAAFEVDEGENLWLGLRALWGALFTVMSFLTTTGFESAEWDTARSWSGLGTPGMILMGLAIMGGGVATTAGGVKLMRVFALYLNGLQEMQRLVHPSAVSGIGVVARRIGRQGAYHAWVFFMLFAMSLAALMMLLALSGQNFEDSTVLAVSALTTTGPLLTLASETPIDLAGLGLGGKLVFAGGMVLGRLELLAFIALLNPDLWRD